MNKLTAFVLALFCALSLASCGGTQTDKVLEAWVGDLSEEKFRNAIAEYQDNNYTPFTAKGNNELSEVTFKTDFEISSCHVVLPSKVENNDIDLERHGGIYLAVDSKFKNNKVTVSTGWWYEYHISERDETLWSYLVCVKDTEGIEHYYYFRTDYSS